MAHVEKNRNRSTDVGFRMLCLHSLQLCFLYVEQCKHTPRILTLCGYATHYTLSYQMFILKRICFPLLKGPVDVPFSIVWPRVGSFDPILLTVFAT